MQQQGRGTKDGGLLVCAAMARLADGASLRFPAPDASILCLQLARILAFGLPRASQTAGSYKLKSRAPASKHDDKTRCYQVGNNGSATASDTVGTYH